MSITQSTRPVWKTSDGKEFDEEQDAITHEAVLAAETDIPAFLEQSEYKEGKGYTRCRNVIVAWEKFRAEQMGLGTPVVVHPSESCREKEVAP